MGGYHRPVGLKEFVDELFSCHYGGMVVYMVCGALSAVQRYDFLVEGSRSSSEKSFKIGSKSNGSWVLEETPPLTPLQGAGSA